jgi:hydroxyversicolorone monooxygenase
MEGITLTVSIQSSPCLYQSYDPYSDAGQDPLEERETNRKDPESLVHKAKGIENKLNTAAGLRALMANSAEARKSREHFSARMKNFIPDEEVFSKLLPNYAVGCRRLAPGNPYMRAVQESNVRIHRIGVSKITTKGVIGPEGEEIEVDTIVCATGFDVSFRPRFSVIGRHGVSLQAKWKDIPEGYLSLAVPGVPNYFTVMGPSFPIANGSVMGPLQAVGNYILKMIQKMQCEHIHSWAPKQDVTDAFNEHTQAWTRSSCWADPNCRSWYKNNETGRVNAIWPGSSLHFCELVRSPRWEDFEIKYQNSENMWEFLGLGFVKNQLESEGDLSPYINSDVVEHKFFSFVPNEEEENVRVARRANMVHDSPKVGNPIYP